MREEKVAELVLPGLFRMSAEASIQSLPKRIQRVFSRGQILPDRSAGWESLLAFRLGYEQPESGMRSWFVWPVHLVSGMSDLVAHGIEDLSWEEWQSLRGEAEPEMVALQGLWQDSVEPVSSVVDWLEVQLEAEGRWEGLPPSTGWGRPMQIPSLDQPVHRRLQVFTATLPMLWSTHPSNVQRQQTGRRIAHSLWFWSPGERPSLPETTCRRVAGGGSLARCLCSRSVVAWTDDPLDTKADLTIMERLLRVPARQQSEMLEHFSDTLLARRLQELLRGDWSKLVIRDPGFWQIHLSRGQWLRFWRRRIPDALQLSNPEFIGNPS